MNPNLRAWIAVASAVCGTFMALLDVSVTNASLPQIQGEIGATGTEGTWISTGYLAAETVMIPLTAWFTRFMGIRGFLIMSTVIFTVFSALCGFATNLAEMIIGRVGQGFGGGAMIPTALTIIATRLPREKHATGLAIYVATAITAPVIGPILGGWLTENVSWKIIFFMNLPVGVLLIFLLYLGMEREETSWKELGRADWLGIAGLAVFLASLIVVLEEGQRENWFDSAVIIRLTILTGVGFICLMAAQFRNAHPVIKLRLLLKPDFGSLFGIMVMTGGGFYVMLYVVPIFLGTVAGYSAQQTGYVAMYLGMAALVVMPILAFTMTRIDIRWVVAIGLVFFAAGCLVNLDITAQTVGQDFIVSQIFCGIGQGAVSLTLNQVATSGLPEEDIPDGTALYSVSRNLGGSIGLALTGVLLDRRMEFHRVEISQSVTANDPNIQERMAQLSAELMRGGADQAYATLRSLKLFSGEIQRQAVVMSYIDGFYVLGVITLLTIPGVLWLNRRIDPASLPVH